VLDDIGEDGMELVRDIREIHDNYEFTTELLAASLRHPQHVLEAALAGADVGTMPYAVFEKLWKHPMTDIGLERFLADWKKAKGS
jgi:transaldolase